MAILLVVKSRVAKALTRAFLLNEKRSKELEKLMRKWIGRKVKIEELIAYEK